MGEPRLHTPTASLGKSVHSLCETNARVKGAAQAVFRLGSIPHTSVHPTLSMTVGAPASIPADFLALSVAAHYG